MSNNILLAFLCFSVAIGLSVVLYTVVKEELRIRQLNKQIDELLRQGEDEQGN